MDGADNDTLKQLLMQMATIAQALDRRSELAVERVDASTAALEQGLHALSDGAGRFVHEATHAMREEASRVLAQEAGSALALVNRQLLASAEAAQRAVGVMEEQCRRLTAARRSMLWNALGALLVGSLLAVGAAGAIGWKTAREVRDAQFGEDILRATQSGALTRCGKDLCVRVGERARRYDRNAVYVLISE